MGASYETRADTRDVVELRRWQEEEYRIYDAGPFGKVDPRLVVMAKLVAGNGHDQDVASSLAKRARTALAACSTTGMQHTTLADQLAASFGDSALEAVLICRLAECHLWRRFIRALEAFA